MAQNTVQYQRGLSLLEFFEQHGTQQQQCEDLVRKRRRPEGFVCPRCQAVWHSEFRRTDRIEIDDAYLGGEVQGGKAGRGSPSKVAKEEVAEGQDHVPRRGRTPSHAARDGGLSGCLAGGSARVRPNPSVNATRYGRRRKPAVRQFRHRRIPGLQRTPPRAPYLQRQAAQYEPLARAR
jgi:hypothetical protein